MQPDVSSRGASSQEARAQQHERRESLAALTVQTDQTEIKKLVADRREAEERFRLMADHAPVLLWLSGTDSNCYFFNQGWLRFTGRTMEQELGIGWTEGVHAEDFERCMRVYMEAFVRREPFAMEYRLRRADSEYRWVYDQGTPRFTVDGSFTGYVGSAVDVTDQHEARRALSQSAEALRRSEGQLRRILDAAPDAILALDADDAIVTVNPAGAAMFACAPSAMVGTRLEKWVQRSRETSGAARREPGPALEEVLCFRADGIAFPGELSRSRGASDDGVERVAIIRDCTAVRGLERQILETGEAVRRKFGRDLHDDLGQLLTGVAFLAQGLVADAAPAMASRVKRLVSLVNDAIARAHKIAEGLAPALVEGKSIDERLEELARTTADTFGVECGVQTRGSFADLGAEDRLQLFLIAQEAVTNAVRHARARHIEIALRHEGRRRTLAIRDDGGGFEPPARREGLGLRNMEYRARILGGQFELCRAAGGGVEVRCTW